MAEITTQNAGEVAKAIRANASAGESSSTVRRSPTLTAYAKAMVKAQRAMKNPSKDAVNPHFKSRYADLPGVLEAVMPPLHENGFMVQQFPCEVDEMPALLTLVVHESGEWVETVIKLRPAKNDPQGVGSALTYMRRYSLLSIAGVAADDDDDGNAASRSQPARQQQQPTAANDNPALRAAYAQRLAQCKNYDDYNAVCCDVGTDLKAGKLSETDKTHLRPVFEETAKRCPRPGVKA